MARIRTIKPEFPQSETMGKLSRNARLLFILLWTIADDSGRARGNLRFLSGSLFPYDDDASELIETWIEELERSGCVRRYLVEDKQYLDIPNFLKHQKIEKPSPSRLPEFTEEVASVRRIVTEASPPYLGPSTVVPGPSTVVPSISAPPAASPTDRAARLQIEILPDEWRAFCQQERPELEPDRVWAEFRDYWIAQPGKDGRKTDWFATWRNRVRSVRAQKTSLFEQKPPLTLEQADKLGRS